MPNEYSVELHQLISGYIVEAEAAARDPEADQAYWQGRMEELLWMRDFLARNIDLKGFTYY